MTKNNPSIIIVGGGAAGLELASLLGNSLGKKNRAKIILVNDTLTHIWKPLLHEVAAGTLDSHQDEMNYIPLAHQHHFYFELGKFSGLDKESKTIDIQLETTEAGAIKKLSYDILIIAIGSITNHFNTPGVKENCFLLDSREQAELLHKRYLLYFMQQKQHQDKALEIAIIGGGATGIELAAELHYAAKQFNYYDLTSSYTHITLIEAGQRLLSALPDALAQKISAELADKNVKILTNTRVKSVTPEGIFTSNEEFVPATFKIWTAGIKCSDMLSNLGLETNQINQIIVKQSLQTTVDDSIYAIGDCASCPQPKSEKPVPPRAQAAHQQALHLAKYLPAFLDGKNLNNFIYHDYGSLVSLSRYTAIGQFMTQRGLNLGIEGKLARWIYAILYKRHQLTLLGWWKILLSSFANFLTKPIKPRLKLH